MNVGRFGNGVRFAVDQHKLVRIEFREDILTRPLRWRKNYRIFPFDMTDLFLRHHPDEWIDKVFYMMFRARNHFFQVVTKRVDRALAYMTSDRTKEVWASLGMKMPLENVIMIASAENQQEYDHRMPLLIALPARYRGLSLEPLIGPIDLTPPVWRGTNVNNDDWLQELDWVIVGGESGSRARAMHLDWARQILLRCAQRRDMGAPWPLPAFMKQIGSVPVMDELEWRKLMQLFEASPKERKFPLLNAKNRNKALPGTVPIKTNHPKGGDPREWMNSLKVREFPVLNLPYGNMFPHGSVRWPGVSSLFHPFRCYR